VKEGKSIWNKPRNIIIEACDFYEVSEIDFKYDYIVVYDLESIQVELPLEEDKKLKFIKEHVAVSVSIASNIPGYEETKFILDRNPRELCKQMFEYFDILAAEAARLMRIKFERLLNTVKDAKLLTQIKDYVDVLPIVGFNSSFYDIGLLFKDGFMEEILARSKNPFVIKDGNRYKVIKTNTLMFLDQITYCAAGTSLSKFINAYDIEEKKGIFPYEWFDSYDKLDYLVKDLTINDFYSELKRSHISEEDFDNLMKYCDENNIIYIHELLKWYNNLDVEPMLKACLKQKEFFYGFHLDMYKDGYSLPALAENILFQHQISGFDEFIEKTKTPTPGHSLPYLGDWYISERIANYKLQDRKAERNLKK
jgi:hypothetical protein